VSRLTVIYHVRSDACAIEARAQAIAVEQSVEMPLSAIEDRQILDQIVGRVEHINALSPGLYAVRIALSRATVGDDPGQLINMLFGNTSLQEDVVLHDAELPLEMVRRHGGPNLATVAVPRAVAPRALAARGPSVRALGRAGRSWCITTVQPPPGTPKAPVLFGSPHWLRQASRREASIMPYRRWPIEYGWPLSWSSSGFLC